MKNSVVIYRGLSALDNVTPIVVILTGLKVSKNGKTGNILQTYILLDAVSPLDAIAQRADIAVCGHCKHRGDSNGKGRSCYVNVGQAPLALWRSHKNGNIPDRSDIRSDLGNGRIVRLGSYGDPAAVPQYVWDELLEYSTAHTGYSHQWQQHDSVGLRASCMASVDSVQEATQAQALGYRTFRVVASADTPLMAKEVYCPATQEGGMRRTCETCKACHGSGSGVSIAVVAHGLKHKVESFKRLSLQLV